MSNSDFIIVECILKNLVLSVLDSMEAKNIISKNTM